MTEEMKDAHADESSMEDSRPRAPRRRIWGWVILVWYGWNWLATTVSYVVVLGGFVQLPPEQAAAMASVSNWIVLVGIFVATGNLAGAIALAMQKPLAFEILTGSFLINVVALLWNLATTDALRAAGGMGLAGTVVGYGLSAAICAYAWGLRRAVRAREDHRAVEQ